MSEVLFYKISKVYDDDVEETFTIPTDKYQVKFEMDVLKSGRLKWEHNDIVAERQEEERKRREYMQSAAYKRDQERERYYNTPG